MNKQDIAQQKILVTGAHGGLGMALCTTLLEIMSADNLLSPTRQELDFLDKGACVTYLNQHQPNIVIHLAGVVYGLKGNLKYKTRAITDNIQIALNLFKAMEAAPPHKLFIANTVASYAYPYKSMPLREEDLLSGEPHQGEYAYASAKRLMIVLAKIFAQVHDTQCINGLFTNLYGDNDRFDKENGHVVPSLIARAHAAKQSNIPLRVWGGGATTRDFLHFDDAAAAIIVCLKQDKAEAVINIASGIEVSIADVAQHIIKAANIDSLKGDETQPTGIERRVLDVSLLSEYGFKPQISLQQGLSRLYSWYDQNKDIARS